MSKVQRSEDEKTDRATLAIFYILWVLFLLAAAAGLGWLIKGLWTEQTHIALIGLVVSVVGWRLSKLMAACAASTALDIKKKWRR